VVTTTCSCCSGLGAQVGLALNGMVPRKKRKVPHPCSAAEENAASLTGIRDDEAIFIWENCAKMHRHQLESSGVLRTASSRLLRLRSG
jgi:hypothetical protein